MQLLKKMLRLLVVTSLACIEAFLTSLPNAGPFSMFRVWYWRKRGYNFSKSVFIARNVYFLGKVSIGKESSISNNCFLNGCNVGIHIGNKVMIAPNCVLVAFDHGFRDLSIPMINQPVVEDPIIIEDDVWVGANCTITKGVRLGTGCIVAANSAVTKDVKPLDIVGGVPAKVIGARDKESKSKRYED